jgi:UDP-galactose transporter
MSRSQKIAALGTLCMQNSALILSMRYSRSVLHDSYLDGTIVMVMELVKFVVSCALVMRDGGSVQHILQVCARSRAMAVPSLLYVLQNTLQLMAVNNLDASTFSVLSQLKVLTTAVASAIFLGTKISPRKWRALALLCGGCILVNYRPAPTGVLSASQQASAAAEWSTFVFGLGCTLAMVTLSGCTGVYIESQLKNAQATLWERNVQLSLWGMCFAAGSLLLRDADAVLSRGFFAGWSGMALVVVLCQSVGGLVTAVVVKYTDTIIKGFVVGLSVVITTVLSKFLFGTELTMQFTMGAGAVLLSIFNFNEPDAPAAASSGGAVTSSAALPLVDKSSSLPLVAPSSLTDEESALHKIGIALQSNTGKDR